MGRLILSANLVGIVSLEDMVRILTREASITRIKIRDLYTYFRLNARNLLPDSWIEYQGSIFSLNPLYRTFLFSSLNPNLGQIEKIVS